MIFDAWQVYVLIGVILGVAEILAGGFVLLPLGLGFLLNAILSFFIESLSFQLLSLAVCCLVSLYGVRRFFAGRPNSDRHSGVEAMIGRVVVVEEAVDGSKGSGYVKLFGDRWKALSQDETVYPVGSQVKIAGLDGNKVIVEAVDAKKGF